MRIVHKAYSSEENDRSEEGVKKAQIGVKSFILTLQCFTVLPLAHMVADEELNVKPHSFAFLFLWDYICEHL